MSSIFINLKKYLLFTLTMSVSLFVNIVHAENIPSCAAGATENTAIIATTAHLTDNNDGTITDPEAGLIWKKCSEGQSWSSAGNNCTGTEATYNWQQALLRAQAVNAGTGENFSQSDWRVPNIKELASIVELRCSSPAINNTVFPATAAAFYWSSSPYAPLSAFAWGLGFNFGNDGVVNRSNVNRVRLVRSGQ